MRGSLTFRGKQRPRGKSDKQARPGRKGTYRITATVDPVSVCYGPKR
jgi:hypothetical protein